MAWHNEKGCTSAGPVIVSPSMQATGFVNDHHSCRHRPGPVDRMSA